MSATKNKRSTQAKVAILDLFKQSDVALAHGDIQEQLDGLCNRVTIYRVLDRLIEEGKIHKVIDIDGVSKFMACVECKDEHHHDHHHLHFSCKNCGEVSCLHHVVPRFTLPVGYEADDVNFMVSGTCPNCS